MVCQRCLSLNAHTHSALLAVTDSSVLDEGRCICDVDVELCRDCAANLADLMQTLVKTFKTSIKEISHAAD